MELTVEGSEDVPKVPLSSILGHLILIASLILPYCHPGGILTTAVGVSASSAFRPCSQCHSHQL